jgi:hypothetical protein
VIDACPHVGPALAVDPAGRVHVAWYAGAEGRAGAYHATSGPALDFGALSALAPPGGMPTAQVAVASDHDGGVWVGWEEVEGDGATLRLAGVTGERPPRPIGIGAPAGLLPSLDAAGPRIEGRLLEDLLLKYGDGIRTERPLLEVLVRRLPGGAPSSGLNG